MIYIYGLNGSDEGFKPKQKKLKTALATVRSPVLASEIHRSFHWAVYICKEKDETRSGKIINFLFSLSF